MKEDSGIKIIKAGNAIAEFSVEFVGHDAIKLSGEGQVFILNKK